MIILGQACQGCHDVQLTQVCGLLYRLHSSFQHIRRTIPGCKTSCSGLEFWIVLIFLVCWQFLLRQVHTQVQMELINLHYNTYQQWCIDTNESKHPSIIYSQWGVLCEFLSVSMHCMTFSREKYICHGNNVYAPLWGLWGIHFRTSFQTYNL